MNRTELIEAVAVHAGTDPGAARRHVDAVFDVIMERVTAGERVLVTGFGTFDRLSRPARTARNPRTGLPVAVPATEAPRFRVGQTFRDRVARGNGAEPARAPAPPIAEPVNETAPADNPSEDVMNVKTTKAAKSTKTGKSGKVATIVKAVKDPKAAKTPKAAVAGKGAKAQKAVKPAKSVKAAKPSKPGKGAKAVAKAPKKAGATGKIKTVKAIKGGKKAAR
ncbi:HU family DNA-binding protein [Thermomonospora umbrina]|uniref:Nucleoid protein Hbs n=1 Tax=Thermomonospora umbrina TaxID=111806 RepID=A0A3D9SIT4_9ACTN|nr:HU family DNA-binding protein [Thermomonospora umbrina]REE95848.1 nucleoid protein Hbs [Thermomonospora umbrina]